MEPITLHLWVENQAEAGIPSYLDATDVYLNEVHFDPDGEIEVEEENHITGPPDLVWAEFRRVSADVSMAGHIDYRGTGEPIAGFPSLTACPVELIEGSVEGGTKETEKLARRISTDITIQTWEDFRRAWPTPFLEWIALPRVRVRYNLKNDCPIGIAADRCDDAGDPDGKRLRALMARSSPR